MPKTFLRRSGPAALALTTFAALVIGCGGGGGGGGSSNGTSGTTNVTTSGTSDTTTAGTNSSSAGSTTGTLGGGGTATANGNLPQNSIFYAVSNGSTFDVDYIKEDGTGAGTYASAVPSGNAVVSPNPAVAGQYVFAALPSANASTYGIYRGTSQTVSGANTVVSARYPEIISLDVARDGSKVVYVASTALGGDLGLYSVSTASGSTPKLIHSAYDAAIDSDGTKVVFSADNAGQSDLYVYDLAAGTTTAVTATGDVFEDDPQFSKDGNAVVFSEQLASGAYRLGSVSTPGGAVTEIDPFPGVQGVVLRSPSLNAAGTRVSFVATDSTDGSHSGLYTCALDGSGVIRVVPSSQLLNSSYWTTLQGRSTTGGAFHFGVPRRKAAPRP